MPEKASLVGFDDSPVDNETSPQPTTMRQPFDRISCEMVRLLLEVIDGNQAATRTLPTELVRRESA